ncbi:enolase C-terminal domain-like protein, partial [Streptococcus pyogenes]
ADFTPIRKLREKSKCRIRVDTNCAWEGDKIGPLSSELKELGVEFIEQPLHPRLNDQMPNYLRQSALPILADESCVLY